VLTPVIDALVARPDVDASALTGYGVSQAGYWLPRALAFEHRLVAAVADPGVVDVSTSWMRFLPPEMVQLLDGGEKDTFNGYMAQIGGDPAAAREFAFRARPYGIADPYDLFTAVRSYHLRDVAARIRTPLLITSPDDEQFWPGQSDQLAGLLTGLHEVIALGEPALPAPRAAPDRDADVRLARGAPGLSGRTGRDRRAAPIDDTLTVRPIGECLGIRRGDAALGGGGAHSRFALGRVGRRERVDVVHERPEVTLGIAAATGRPAEGGAQDLGGVPLAVGDPLGVDPPQEPVQVGLGQAPVRGEGGEGVEDAGAHPTGVVVDHRAPGHHRAEGGGGLGVEVVPAPPIAQRAGPGAAVVAIVRGQRVEELAEPLDFRCPWHRR
jgi:hypothetical protein